MLVIGFEPFGCISFRLETSLCSSYLIKFSKKIFGPHNFLRLSWVEIYENKNFICFCLSLRAISNFWSCENKLAHCAQVNVKNWHA